MQWMSADTGLGGLTHAQRLNYECGIYGVEVIIYGWNENDNKATYTIFTIKILIKISI